MDSYDNGNKFQIFSLFSHLFRFMTAPADKGSNTSYMILKPGYKQILTDRNDTLTIMVLEETKMVDGVRTRIVN